MYEKTKLKLNHGKCVGNRWKHFRKDLEGQIKVLNELISGEGNKIGINGPGHNNSNFTPYSFILIDVKIAQG